MLADLNPLCSNYSHEQSSLHALLASSKCTYYRTLTLQLAAKPQSFLKHVRHAHVFTGSHDSCDVDLVIIS